MKSLKSKILLIDNMTTAYITIFLFLVSFIVTRAQQSNMNLSGKELGIFLICISGSLICILIRFIMCYGCLIKQQFSKKKIPGLICYTILGLIMIEKTLYTLYISNWSIEHEYLYNYTMLQLFMLGMVIVQWIGMKVFSA